MAQKRSQILIEALTQLDSTGKGTVSAEELIDVLVTADIVGAHRLVKAFSGSKADPVEYKAFLDWLCLEGGLSRPDSQQGTADAAPDDKNDNSRASSPGLKTNSFKRAVKLAGMAMQWKRYASGVSFATEAHVPGALQDNPELPAMRLRPPRPTAEVRIEFGSHKFRGLEAAPWLEKFGLSPDDLDDMAWTTKHADAVAAAVATWAMARGATMVCHWTQPMRSATCTWRATEPTRMVHALFNPGGDGKAVCILDGSYLLHGEGDSRKMIDITSAMWVRGDTLFIPSVLVNYNNSSFSGMDPVLDEKTPLLRAMHAVSLAGVRLLGLLGHKCHGIVPKIGLEQEFFLVPRAAYDRRLDLQRCGRTLLGEPPAHGTDLYDTHSGPMNDVAHACMAEIQSECFKLGIQLRTRHRESAPNQYEFAPHYGVATAQVDENIVAMEIIEDVARKHGLVALLHEKPFAGVNGSGKHNNFSLGTDTGLNLFHEVHANSIKGPKLGQNEAFPVIMAAVCSAVYRHGNLLMTSVACPGNDFRLSKTGGCEAPPTCISIHLGESLTAHLTEFANSSAPIEKPYAVAKTKVMLGIPAIDQHGIDISTEPRNRTAPLPFAGRRFELRSCGSSQNVSMVNVVLCTAIAEAFNLFSDEIEKGSTPREVATKALTEGGGLKAIHNDSNYTAEWRAEAEARGLVSVDSVVAAICQLGEEKSIALFESLNVLSRQELSERMDVMLENYVITVEVEARCMLDMISRQIIPAGRAAGLENAQELLTALTESASALKTEVDALHDIEELEDQANKAKDLRLTTMPAVRALCDQLEGLVPFSHWPIARYHELLFDDMKHCR